MSRAIVLNRFAGTLSPFHQNGSESILASICVKCRTQGFVRHAQESTRVTDIQIGQVNNDSPLTINEKSEQKIAPNGSVDRSSLASGLPKC